MLVIQAKGSLVQAMLLNRSDTQPPWLNQDAAEAGKACNASAPTGLQLSCNLVALAAMPVDQW